MLTRRVNELEYLRSPLIAAPHGFSTRLGGVSQGYLASLNLGIHRGDTPENLRENYRRFCAATGTDETRLVTANQVHGVTVRAVDGHDVKPELMAPAPFEADGLVTDTPGVTLAVFTADCIPVLFFDPAGKAVGACHSGWRGTAGGIAAVTAEEMVRRYGCAASELRAAIGPGIGPCCFETDGDVPQAMTAALGELAAPYIRRRGEKFRVDLKEIVRASLLRAGVLPEHIDVCEACTCCEHERFWSHRYTGGRRGSQAAVIMLEGGA